MANNNGIITAPVNEEDVQYVLSEDCGGDWRRMCSSDQINMWARYKPQRLEKISPLTYWERSLLRNDNSKFGLKIPFCSNGATNVMNFVVWKLACDPDYDPDNPNDPYHDIGWVYLKPRGDRTPQGGIREFSRISDFVRHPSELTQAASASEGDPTPVALQGYNHNAELPVTGYFDMTGINEMYDITNGDYSEINVSLATTIKFTLYNSGGNDLHMQDLVETNILVPQGFSWRPVVQVWSDWHQTNSDHWWERTTPDFEVAGDPISTANTSGMVSVEFNIATLINAGKLRLDQLYHMCIGIGLCTNNQQSPATPLSWHTNPNPSLFILPYTKSQQDDLDFPFYHKFILREHTPTFIHITELQYHVSSWTVVTPTGSSVFEVSRIADQQLRLTIEITKTSKDMEFMANNEQLEDPNKLPLIIDARMSINGGSETSNYLEPKVINPDNGDWQSPTYHPIVLAKTPGSSVVETSMLYATVLLNLSDVPTNGWAEIHFHAYTGGSQWNILGYMSIKKV